MARLRWGGNGQPYGLAVDGQGNVYIAGTVNNSAAIIKYDADGNQLWARLDESSSLFAVAVDALGNAYVTGYSTSNGTHHYFTAKYYANEIRCWEAWYDGPGDGADIAHGIALDTQGNVYVTGSSSSETGRDDDFATIKYDVNGTQIWVARYQGPANSDDSARTIAVDDTGNVYVAGSSNGTRGGRSPLGDYAVIKYDGSGNQLWGARYEGPEGSDNQLLAMTLDDSGKVFVTGRSFIGLSSSDYATVAYSSDGHQLWSARYHGPSSGVEGASAIAIDGNGNTVVAGSTHGIRSSDHTHSPWHNVPQYGIADSTINGNVGQEFAIGLYSVPRVGEYWSETYDKGTIFLVDNEFVELQPTVSGYTWYLFKPLKAGAAAIMFTLQQTGGPVRDQKTFQILVN